MLGNLGVTEWMVILVIVLLLFGGKKLPGLAKSLGSGINEFKKGLSGKAMEELEEDEYEEEVETKKPVKKIASSSKKKTATRKKAKTK